MGKILKRSELKKIFLLYLYRIIRVMANVAMMTDGLKRRQTYEEVIDYIEHDKDKITYPDRTAKQ